ncbi:hypothetical protein ACOME3_007749 [Neoechinorhynchus agilis]
MFRDTRHRSQVREYIMKGRIGAAILAAKRYKARFFDDNRYLFVCLLLESFVECRRGFDDSYNEYNTNGKKFQAYLSSKMPTPRTNSVLKRKSSGALIPLAGRRHNQLRFPKIKIPNRDVETARTAQLLSYAKKIHTFARDTIMKHDSAFPSKDIQLAFNPKEILKSLVLVTLSVFSKHSAFSAMYRIRGEYCTMDRRCAIANLLNEKLITYASYNPISEFEHLITKARNQALNNEKEEPFTLNPIVKSRSPFMRDNP